MEEKIRERFDKLSEIENYIQLNEDLETGKNIIVDYKGNNFECDKFGIPTIKYYKNVTGLKSYNTRLNKGLIKELKYDSIQYIPNSRRLIGSPKYPRSLSTPLSGTIEQSQKLIETINKNHICNELKNKKIFNLKNNKKEKVLPKYFCVKLGADSPKTRKYLINLFDEDIKEIKKECNNDSHYYLRNSKYRALSNYKSFFKNNLTKNLLNGNKIPYSKQEDINQKFTIVKNLIKKDGWKKMHIERQNINQEEYEQLYKIKGVGDKNNIIKKKLSNFNSFNFGQNEGSNYLIKKDIDINKYKNPLKNNIDNKRNISSALISPRNKQNNNRNASNYFKSRQKKLIDLHNENIYSSFQNNLSKSINKCGSTNTTGLNYSKDSKILKNTISNRKGLYSPRIFSNLKLDFSNLDSQSIFNSKEEKRFISGDIKNNKNNQEINDINSEKRIRKLYEIKKKYEKEKKLIKGYELHVETEEFVEDDFIGFKKRPPKYISPILVYKREIELLKKINPIQYNRQLKKILFEDKLLMKRLENRKIFEKIKLKKYKV